MLVLFTPFVDLVEKPDHVVILILVCESLVEELVFNLKLKSSCFCGCEVIFSVNIVLSRYTRCSSAEENLNEKVFT